MKYQGGVRWPISKLFLSWLLSLCQTNHKSPLLSKILCLNIDRIIACLYMHKIHILRYGSVIQYTNSRVYTHEHTRIRAHVHTHTDANTVARFHTGFYEVRGGSSLLLPLQLTCVYAPYKW